MSTEYETKVLDIDVGEIMGRLRELGAEEFDEVLMKRWVFNLGNLNGDDAERYRLRQIGNDKTQLTYKKRSSKEIGNTEEIEIEVSDFEKAFALLDKLDWQGKFYQENYRKVFVLGDLEFSLDRWPMIPVHLEVESVNKERVEEGLKLLGLEGKDIGDISVERVYKKYGIDLHDYEILKFE